MLISPILLSHCRTEVCTSIYTPVCLFSPVSSLKLLLWWRDWTATFTPPSSFQAIFQLCFSIYFCSFFILSLWVFFLLFHPPPLPSCRRPYAAFILWGLFVYFFALTLQYFLFTFFTTPQFYWVFYSSLALCRNSPRPKCNAQIEDYSHCPVITYSYSHGWVSYMLTFIAVLNSGVQKGKIVESFVGKLWMVFMKLKSLK